MRDVIADGVAQDVIERFGFGYISALLPDDSNELALVIETLSFLSEWVDWNRIKGTTQRGDRFVLESTRVRILNVNKGTRYLVIQSYKQHGVLWHGHARFLRMESIVEPQASNRPDILGGQRG